MRFALFDLFLCLVKACFPWLPVDGSTGPLLFGLAPLPRYVTFGSVFLCSWVSHWNPLPFVLHRFFRILDPSLDRLDPIAPHSIFRAEEGQLRSDCLLNRLGLLEGCPNLWPLFGPVACVALSLTS